MFEPLLHRTAKLLDAVVPDSLRDPGGEEAVRARTVVGLAVLATVVFSALGVVRALTGRATLATADAVLALAMGSVPLLLRRFGRVSMLVNGALFLAFTSFVALCVGSLGGGLNLPGIGLAMVPLIAVLLVGLRAGFLWLLLCTGASMGIGVLAQLRLIAPRTVESLAAEHVGLLIVGVLLYVVGGLYEYRKTLSLGHIAELEERRFRAEKDRRKAVDEVKIAEAERLAALGEIAAMAAHEINNPLSYVANNLHFVERSLRSAGGEALVAIQEARDGVGRIQRIVEDLQQYGRPERDEAAIASVRAAVETALKTVEGHTRPRARVTTEIGEIPSVVASPGRLVQILLNLILNAAQAIPEGHADENEIVVRARQEGDRVVIEIHDSGPGIPREILGRVKETFFTTKTDRGSGLGLALCERILGRFGGELHLANGPRGAIAKVTLFAVNAEPPVETRVTVPPSVEPLSRRRILLVDDEPLVIRAISRHLAEHDVRTVTSGREAVELLGEGETFDAILCDMMMPDLTGMDVHDFVRARRPELLDRVLFMTGGTFTDRMRDFSQTVKNPFLKKPVQIAELRVLLSQVAGGPVALTRASSS